jgi:hypothetical protein
MLLECLNWSSAFQDNHSHTLPDFDWTSAISHRWR